MAKPQIDPASPPTRATKLAGLQTRFLKETIDISNPYNTKFKDESQCINENNKNAIPSTQTSARETRLETR
jgi:hypothetical protein